MKTSLFLRLGSLQALRSSEGLATHRCCVVGLGWGDLFAPRGRVAGVLFALGLSPGGPCGVAGAGPALGRGRRRRLGRASRRRQFAASPQGPFLCLLCHQQYSPFHMDKLECGQLGGWRASPPATAVAPPEQQLHSEGGDLLYAPSYSLPFYRYGHFPLDSHVFSSKKPVLPAKFGPPQGSPCEVARFLLSALPASGECQWHYANPLVPSSPSPAKHLSEPPANPARHGLVPNYEGGSRLPRGRQWVAHGKRTLTLWADRPLFSASKRGGGGGGPPLCCSVPVLHEHERSWVTEAVCLMGTSDR